MLRKYVFILHIYPIFALISKEKYFHLHYFTCIFPNCSSFLIFKAYGFDLNELMIKSNQIFNLLIMISTSDLDLFWIPSQCFFFFFL